jgi:hypothetical protein
VQRDRRCIVAARVHHQNRIFSGMAITGISAQGARDALRHLAQNGQHSHHSNVLLKLQAAPSVWHKMVGKRSFGNCLGRGMSAALVELVASSINGNIVILL